MAQRKYSEEAVREILNRATEAQLREGDFDDEQLQQMAQELGISEVALVHAREQYLAEQGETTLSVAEEDELSEFGITPEIRERYEQHRRRGFYKRLLNYAIMSVFLFFINLASGGNWWFHWPVLGWGIYLAFQAQRTFIPARDSDDYEKDLIQWHTKRVRRRE